MVRICPECSKMVGTDDVYVTCVVGYCEHCGRTKTLIDFIEGRP